MVDTIKKNSFDNGRWMLWIIVNNVFVYKRELLIKAENTDPYQSVTMNASDSIPKLI